MFDSLEKDEEILLKIWNDMDSICESRDYNALYTQHEPAIKRLIQSVTAGASKPFSTLHNCQTVKEFRIIFGCMCKRYLDQLRKKRNVDRRNFGFINYLDSAVYSAICELEKGKLFRTKTAGSLTMAILGHATQGTQSSFEKNPKV
jgi:hypothetical protein